MAFILESSRNQGHIYLELRKSEDPKKYEKKEAKEGRNEQEKDLISQLEKVLAYFAFSIYLLQFKGTASFSPYTIVMKMASHKQINKIKISIYFMRSNSKTLQELPQCQKY